MIQQSLFAQHAKHRFGNESAIGRAEFAMFAKVAAEYGICRKIKSQHGNECCDSMFKRRGGYFQWNTNQIQLFFAEAYLRNHLFAARRAIAPDE